jgi:hypothetical protein
VDQNRSNFRKAAKELLLVFCASSDGAVPQARRYPALKESKKGKQNLVNPIFAIPEILYLYIAPALQETDYSPGKTSCFPVIDLIALVFTGLLSP